MQFFTLHRFQVYTFLLFGLVSLFACSVDRDEITPLSFEAIEGYWVTETWQTSSNATSLAPITIQFTAANVGGLFREVPNNTLGYQNEELVFRRLEGVGERRIQGEMLIKEDNSTQETWMRVFITKTEGEEIFVEVDCNNCTNSFFILRRK